MTVLRLFSLNYPCGTMLNVGDDNAVGIRRNRPATHIAWCIDNVAIRAVKYMLVLMILLVSHRCTVAQRTQQEPKQPIMFSGTTNLIAARNGGKVLFATSQLDDEFWKVENLIDGVVKKTNGWASSRAVFPQDIVFAFKGKQPKLINRIVIDPTTPDGPLPGRWINEFELFVSDKYPDGEWKFVMHGAVRNEPRPQTFYFTPVEGRYVLLRILSNHGSDRYVSLGEVEIYEAVPAIGMLDQLIARLEQLLRDLKQYRETLAQLGPFAVEMPPALRAQLKHAAQQLRDAQEGEKQSSGEGKERSTTPAVKHGDKKQGAKQ